MCVYWIECSILGQWQHYNMVAIPVLQTFLPLVFEAIDRPGRALIGQH